MKIQNQRFLFILLLIIWTSTLFAQTYSQLPLSRQDTAEVLKHQENYEMYLARGDLRNASDFLNQIGRVYWNHNHFEESIEYYTRSLKLNEKLGNENAIAGINSNLGLLYSDIGKFEESVKHLKISVSARRTAKHEKGGKEILFNSLLNLASSVKQLKRYDEAISYLEEALGYAQEINNLEKISVFYLQLAEAHEAAGQKTIGQQYLMKYLAFYKQMSDEVVEKSQMETENEKLRAERIELEKKLQELELKEKEAELVVKQVELEKKEEEVKVYHTKTDSLSNTLSKAQLARQFLEEQSERERAQRQLTQIVFASILLIVLSVTFFFIYAFRQKKKANKDLENKNAEILRQQKEIIRQRDALNETNKKLDGKNHQIMESIRYAKLIQSAMLEGTSTLQEMIPDSFILFKPRDIVSGDFYWYEQIGEKIFIAAVDCTGHGVPGAFMSMIGNNLLDHIILNRDIYEPDQILHEMHIGVNKALHQEQTGNRDGMDVSLYVIDKKKKTISFAGAGNPLIVIQNGELVQTKGSKFGVGGIYRNEVIYEKTEFPIDGDTVIYTFSDGYQDQFGGDKGRKFNIRQMRKVFEEIYQKNMIDQKQILEETIEKWKNQGDGKQIDDIIVIGVHLPA